MTNNDLSKYAKRQRARESSYMKRFSMILRSQYRIASRDYNYLAVFSSVEAELMTAELNKLYDQIIKDEYEEAYKFYIQPLLKKNNDKKDFLDDLASVFRSDFALYISEFIRNYASTYLLSKIQLINSTTEDNIRQIIENGRSNGYTNREIARAILMQGRSEEITNRARTIARTETSQAGNKGRMLAIESSDFMFNKLWQGILDSRIRNSHRQMDMLGYVPFNHVFMVPRKRGGVDRMMYPHDPSGSADNLVNCRCVLVFDVQRDARGNPIRKN